jgi:signal peptide peptidase SppA
MLLSPTFQIGPVVQQMISAPSTTDTHLDAFCAAWGVERVERKPYGFADGIAIIPVHGTLLNRFGGSWGYATGYDYIRGAFDAALADSQVQGIVFDVDSYGGEVHGCFELSDHVRANRGKKPIMALVNASAYSAGYALASAADKITLTPSGGAGSIGVVTMHVDYSKMLAENGIKVEFIYAGKHKVDGSPYRPLTKDARDSIQARIDGTYEKFVSLVSRNRRMDAAKVRGTEAACFSAEEAKQNGLIDAVAPPREAFTAFSSRINGTSQEYDQMSIENTETTAGAPAPEAIETPAADAAPAVEAPVAAAPAADAAAAERARISAILGSPEAKDRDGLANHLALNTELSVDAARAILAASPAIAAKPAVAAAFEAAMSEGNPNVGSEGDNASAALDPVQMILRDHSAATGVKYN